MTMGSSSNNEVVNSDHRAGHSSSVGSSDYHAD